MGWGFAFWMFSPLPGMAMHELPGEDAVVPVLKENLTASGVFFSPWPGMPEGTTEEKKAALAAMVEKHQAGPLVQIFYHRDGIHPDDPKMFAKGYANFFVSALLASVALAMAVPAVGGYFRRVAFVVVLGLFACVSISLSQPIWFHHPWDYHLMTSAYHLGDALLMGIVLGLFIWRREKPAAEA